MQVIGYNTTIHGTTSKTLISYIERVCNYLNLDQYGYALIDIKFSKDLPGNAGGYCDGDDEDINVEIARNDAAGRIPMKDLMVNIAHELVHAHQMASGRLVNMGLTMRTNDHGEHYMGNVTIFDGVDYENVPYDQQPWEIEAYNLEKVVYEECK